MPALYESIGTTYTVTRRPDPRIAIQIREAIGPSGTACTVLNVGGGAGNYEPTDCAVVALDPSLTMLRQRSHMHGPAVCGVAEYLPFGDNQFDATIGTFTIHHWSDIPRGLSEARRVSRRQVFLMYEPSFAHRMWIIEYFPELLDLPHERRAPSVTDISAHLDVVEVQVVPVPHDCVDGFGGAYWARPEMYLEPHVQGGMSMLAALEPAVRGAGTRRLRDSLMSGEWDAKFGDLRGQREIDLGYRLIIAGS